MKINSEKIKLFVFKDSSKGCQFGVGTYINTLVKEVKQKGIDVLLVNLLPEKYKTNRDTHIINEEIHLYYKESRTNCEVADKESAEDLFRNFKKYLGKGRNVFHFNTTLYLFNFITILNNNKCGKIIFTYHKLTWRYYKNTEWNNFLLFLKDDSDLFSNIVKKTLLLEKKVCEMSDEIICLTNQSYDYIKDFYEIPAKKISRIRNGINFSDYDIDFQNGDIQKIKNELNINHNEKLILFVGRIEVEKGVFKLLDAFEILLSIEPNIRLFIVGDGFTRDLIEACPLKLVTKVSFTGHLNHSELNCLYRICDVGVIPSVNEEISYVALEMMKHKLPIVCTDAGGLGEMFVDNNSAKVVKTNYNSDGITSFSSKELSKKINCVLNNDDLKLDLKNGAFKLLKEEYSINKMIDKTIKTYFS